jgi:hypothetical protein
MKVNENKNTELKVGPMTELKRTHAKPYKVGKLYFGRASKMRGSSWIVSASEDLSDPLATYEVGKQARAHCEDTRDAAKADTVDVPAEISVNIPKGAGLVDMFSNTREDIV